MSLERVRALVTTWRAEIAELRAAPGRELPAGLDRDEATGMFESMLLARHLDVAAHELRGRGAGHYTICSAGHEGNVVLGRLAGPRDPSLLHYRSAALVVERSRQVATVDVVREIALSLVASREESTSGGRHKVFGHRALGVIPQTSTIASHLPRAVGLAFAIERRARLAGLAPPPSPGLGADSIAVVSFGDASLNHSTALGALNAAGWVAHQRLKLPLLFVCEDNGLGISVRSPAGWVERRLRALPNVAYFGADGSDLASAWEGARAAVAHVRQARLPAVLHLRCERLLGHAGSDVDTTYRAPAELEAALARDPVLGAARILIESGALDAERALALDREAAARVEAEAARAVERPKLESRREIVRTIAAPADPEIHTEAAATADAAEGPAITLAQGVTAALAEALDRRPEVLIFGEDVARKGGVYGLTKGLLKRAGPARVFNTLLDEQTILGLALGAATLGLLPVPEIQYLAYLHNAEDQLRGEAATMRFFSNEAYDNPMVVRIASFAYQKGFGGHFHNDHSVAVLRDLPGVIVAVPARGDDALEILRTAFELATRTRRVVVVLEPIALYHTRDLHEAGDGAWAAKPTDAAARFGSPRLYAADAPDLSIATYGNGVRMSLRACRRLEREHGVRARVIDLRWLAPLPLDEVVRHAAATGALLVVDECRESGSVSEALGTAMAERASGARFARVTSADSFVPLGKAADLVLVSEGEIVDAALEIAKLSNGH